VTSDHLSRFELTIAASLGDGREVVNHDGGNSADASGRSHPHAMKARRSVSRSIEREDRSCSILSVILDVGSQRRLSTESRPQFGCPGQVAAMHRYCSRRSRGDAKWLNTRDGWLGLCRRRQHRDANGPGAGERRNSHNEAG
jgi:hypothetical protein